MKSTITQRSNRNENSEEMGRGNRPISRLPMPLMRGGRGQPGAAGKMLPQDAMKPLPVDSGPAIRPVPAAAAQSALNSAQLSPMPTTAVTPGAALNGVGASPAGAMQQIGIAPAMKRGGKVQGKTEAKFSSGGSTSKASSRGDGIAQRGKTKGRYI